METGLTRRDGNLRDARDVASLPANLHFPFHVESETVTVSSGSAVQSKKVLRRAHPANRKMKVKIFFRALRGSRIIKTERGLETAIQMMSQSVLRTLALASLPDQTSS